MKPIQDLIQKVSSTGVFAEMHLSVRHCSTVETPAVQAVLLNPWQMPTASFLAFFPLQVTRCSLLPKMISFFKIQRVTKLKIWFLYGLQEFFANSLRVQITQAYPGQRGNDWGPVGGRELSQSSQATAKPPGLKAGWSGAAVEGATGYNRFLCKQRLRRTRTHGTDKVTVWLPSRGEIFCPLPANTKWVSW